MLHSNGIMQEDKVMEVEELQNIAFLLGFFSGILVTVVIAFILMKAME